MKKLPKLYIIHGWTYTVAPWSKTLAILEKKGVEVEMLHVPGLTSASKKVWTIEDYVQWADHQIPDGAVALGHSNGGRILLNLCSQKPEKLSHLILLDSAGVYEVSNKRDVARVISKTFGFLKQIPGVARVWHKLTGATDYARAPENMKKTLSNMLESDRVLAMDKVTTPTSILWGADDTVTPPRQAEVMQKTLPNASLEIFPGWTHAPYLSHPEELARAIWRVLKTPPARMAAPVIDDTTSGSASRVLKRAPEPVLDVKGKRSDVVANVPTKLVLRKDSQLTKGLKVSDAEGAAVRYEPKAKEIVQKKTDAAEVSAANSLRRAKSDAVPDIDAAEVSASGSLKKAAKGAPVPSLAPASASLVLKKNPKEAAGKASKASATKESKTDSVGILAELAEKSDEAVDFVAAAPALGSDEVRLPGAITSGDLPKVGRLEKAKRLVAKGKR